MVYERTSSGTTPEQIRALKEKFHKQKADREALLTISTEGKTPEEVEEIVKELKKALAEARGSKAQLNPPPRYDEVYWEAMEIMDKEMYGE